MTAVFTRIPLQAPVETARNLIPNASFEVNTSGYTAGGGTPTLARVARTGTDPLLGAWNLQITTSAAVTNTDTSVYTDGSILATPGTPYSFSFYSSVTRAGRTALAFLRFFDSGGTQIGSSTVGVAAAVVAGQRYTVSIAAAPAGTVTIRPVIRFIGSAAAGETLYVDGVMLTATAAPIDFFDGYTANIYTPSYVKYSFTVDAGLSPSVIQVAGVGDTLMVRTVEAPTVYGRESRTLVHELLDDPTQSWITSRKGSRRSGEFTAYVGSAAAAIAAVDFFSAGGGWTFDGSGVAPLAIPRFTIPSERSVTTQPVEELVYGDTTADYLWALTIPWQEVTP